MTIYRDEGDAFVTGTYDFTSDVSAFRAALAEVVADGGGDYPEALDEAFDAALTEPAWRDPTTTLQLIFLVADAPPHVERQVTGYDASIRSAEVRRELPYGWGTGRATTAGRSDDAVRKGSNAT